MNASDLFPLTWADAKEIALWLFWGAAGLWVKFHKPTPRTAK